MDERALIHCLYYHLRSLTIYRTFVSWIKDRRDFFTKITQHSGVFADGQNVKLVHIGWDRKLCSYWERRVLSGAVKKKKRMLIKRRLTEKKLELFLKKYDLAVIEQPNSGKIPTGVDDFLLPRWMEMVIDLEEELLHSRTKEARRRIRKYELEYEFRTGAEHYSFFYHRMYKPLVLQNHANTAEIASYRMFFEKFANGGAELLYILKEKKPVAASLIERFADDRIRILAFGILDGRRDFERMGVHAAAYYYAMQHYLKKGIRTMQCGSSMPIAMDGVTQFKIRLGAKPFLRDLPGRKKYVFVLMNPSTRVADILRNNPLLYLEDDHLTMACFPNQKDLESNKSLQQYLKLIQCGNIERIRCFQDNQPEGLYRSLDQQFVIPVELTSYAANSH